MSINVRFFALTRDLAGMSETTLNVRDGASVEFALTSLIEKHPNLKSIEPRLATAVNQSYVKRNHLLRDGDELALIPPVSGG